MHTHFCLDYLFVVTYFFIVGMDVGHFYISKVTLQGGVCHFCGFDAFTYPCCSDTSLCNNYCCNMLSLHSLRALCVMFNACFPLAMDLCIEVNHSENYFL